MAAPNQREDNRWKTPRVQQEITAALAFFLLQSGIAGTVEDAMTQGKPDDGAGD